MKNMRLTLTYHVYRCEIWNFNEVPLRDTFEIYRMMYKDDNAMLLSNCKGKWHEKHVSISNLKGLLILSFPKLLHECPHVNELQRGKKERKRGLLFSMYWKFGYYLEKSFNNEINLTEGKLCCLQRVDIVKSNETPNTLKIQGMDHGYEKYQNFISISQLFLACIKDGSIESHV